MEQDIGDHPAAASGEGKQVGPGQARGEVADNAIRPVERNQRGTVLNSHSLIATRLAAS